MIAANSIVSAKPLQGLKLSLISSNNQTMTTVTTNNDGIANR